MNMLDELTPYYQARMAWLSLQQRKIVEFLCDRRGAVPVKEIAQHSFITHQTTSSQLQDLREKGYVNSITIGRESYYELSEPLMRMCIEVKKSRGEPIRLLVDFLRLWYTPEELQQKLALLTSYATLEHQYLHQAIHESLKEGVDSRVRACVKDYQNYLEKGNFAQALQVSEELIAIRGDSSDWLSKAVCLERMQHWDDALAVNDKVLELDPNNSAVWHQRGWLLQNLDRIDEALASFNKAAELNPVSWVTWFMQSQILYDLKLYNQALAASQKAITLNPSFECGQVLHAEILLALNFWNESRKAINKALKYRCEDRHTIPHTESIIRCLMTDIEHAASWQTRIAGLAKLYYKHRALFALAHGLVESIPAVLNFSTQEIAQKWLVAWQQAAADYAELQLPLRLLDTAIRYHHIEDPRILLELAIEERQLLEKLLGIKSSMKN
ncbi:MAG: tetratricopeptide repeat protein [Acidobacteriota bacterium]